MNDDSFNEADDSFFDLYSTEKVTSTYNNLLEKLKATRKTSESEEVTVIKEKDANESCEDLDDTYVPLPKKTKKKNVEITEVVLSDDSITYPTIAEETCPQRRSARLNKMRTDNTNQSLGSYVSTVDTTRRKRNNRSTARKKGKKKDAKQPDIEVIDSECEGMNTSLDDEMNYEVSVKVIWKSVSVKTFRLRRFQKLSVIYEHFMSEEQVPMEKILLSLRNKKISPCDTPESLDLKVFDFIEGGTLTDSSSIASKTITNERCLNDKDSITIKVQDVQKNIFKFSINKNEAVKSVMMRYAEQIEIPLDHIKFFFDGEVLKPSDTPVTLGLDNDEIIDVKIIQ